MIYWVTIAIDVANVLVFSFLINIKISWIHSQQYCLRLFIHPYTIFSDFEHRNVFEDNLLKEPNITFQVNKHTINFEDDIKFFFSQNCRNQMHIFKYTFSLVKLNYHSLRRLVKLLLFQKYINRYCIINVQHYDIYS